MTANVTVRKFESSDADSVIALWNKVLPSSQPWNEPQAVICRKLNVNDGLFFVGEQDGQVVATVLAGYDGVRGWIYAMAVAEEQRRRGVGRRMLEEAEKVLLARGCAKINLQVRATNSEVIEFYEGCGFSVEDRASLGKPLMSDSKLVSDPVPTIPVNEQITLSQITWDDKPSYLKHLNETDEFHARMGMMPFPYQELDADQWLSKVVRETLETDRRRNWAIRNDHGELIGGTGVFEATKGEKAEMGYWLAKPYWGCGIMSAACVAACRYAFEEFKLLKIAAHVFDFNIGSARVLEKCGFEQEGFLRKHYLKDGKLIDARLYGLLKPE